MKKVVEIFCSIIRRDKERKIQRQEPKSGFNYKELLLIQYSLLQVRKKSIDHLNGLNYCADIKLIYEYLWDITQDSDKLLRAIDGELRKRKISKTYLDLKIENQFSKKSLNVLNTSLKSI